MLSPPVTRRHTEETVDHRYAPSGRAGDFVLSVRREARTAFVVRLPDGVSLRIGRGAEAELCLRSPSLSRLHLALDQRGDGFYLRDLGSRNGTRLGGDAVGSEAVAAQPGTEIVAGEVSLVLLPASSQPKAVRPFLLLSELETRALASSGQHGAAFALARPIDEDPALLELLARLPDSATIALASDQTLVVITDDEASLDWLLTALARGELAPRRVARARTERGRSVVAQLLRELERDEAPAPSDDVPQAFRLPSMLAVHAMLRRIAPRNLSVLLHGETGTGKEVVARELHRLSGRKGALVAVNTAALPDTLIESELFGYEKGAFSGAQSAKAGLIEASHGGTLFLDEIGELPLALQAKLLRVLEERRVRRLGATAEKEIDLRVVAATHRDLEALVREGKFRQDLVYRIEGARIELPPLRQRAGEIPSLAQSLLRELAPGAPLQLSEPAARALEAHAWPGNVRELKHVLERAAAFVDGSTIEVEHLPASIPRGESAPSAAPTASAQPATSGDVRGSVRDFERERIVSALREAGGNRTRAAELLGLPRRTLVYKISKLRITEA
jgi:two-component system, NtrC family, response regulator AtoC